MDGTFERSGIRCFLVVDDASGHALPDGISSVGGGDSVEAVDRLGRELVVAATRWAAGLVGIEPEPLRFPTDVQTAVDAADSTVLLVRPSVARLAPDLGDDLLDDLESGCNVVIGPTLVGGWYLLALTPGNARLIESAGDGSAGSVGQFLHVARAESGLEVGILSSERSLSGEADLRAAVADPLVDAALAALMTELIDAAQSATP